jgi:hypothetical protein
MDLWVPDPRDGGEIMRKTIINRVRQRRVRRDYYRALDNASPSMLHELQSMALRQNS